MRHITTDETLKLVSSCSSKSDKVAKVFKYITNRTVVGTNSTSGLQVWYRFEEHWKLHLSNISIRNIIRNEVQDAISTLYQKLSYEKDIMDPTLHEIHNLSNSFSNADIKRYLNVCHKQVYQAEFHLKLDVYPHLLAFTNGVYDLNKNLFRPIVKEDMCFVNTGFDYTAEVDEEVYPKLKDIFKTVFPNKKERNYLLTFLAACLDGNPINGKELFVWNGPAIDTKSEFVQLMYLLMGGYATRQSSVAYILPPTASYVKSVKGVRLLITDCGKDKASHLLPEAISDFTHSTEIAGKHESYRLQSTLLFCTKGLPQIDGSIVLESLRWSEELDDKVDWEKLAPTLMCILLTRYYPHYKKYGLKYPEEDSLPSPTKKRRVD